MADPRDLFDLTGRVACVTGASAGLGRRAAIALEAAGAKVVGVARRREALQSLQDQSSGNTRIVAADVADREAINTLRDGISAHYGPPDIVVHAAGINTREPASEVTAEGWDKTIALNLSALAAVVAAAAEEEEAGAAASKIDLVASAFVSHRRTRRYQPTVWETD